MKPLVTPRGSLRIEPRADLLVARFHCDDAAWLDLARGTVERVQGAAHPALVPAREVRVTGEDLEVIYAPRPGSAPLSADRLSDVGCAVADVAEGIAAAAALPGEPVRCGPFPPGLLLGDATGGQLLAAGLWSVAYELDRGLRGRAMLMAHFVICPEMLGTARRGPKTETFFLAYALFHRLVGREPFPMEDELGYMQAVRGGASLPASELRPDLPQELCALMMSGLRAQPEARPTLEGFAAALRGIAGGQK